VSRRALQHRELRAAHAPLRAAMRSRARRAHLDRRRLPPVPQSTRAGGYAAPAHAVRAAAALDPAPPGEHLRLPLRGLRVRELPASRAEPRAGGRVSRPDAGAEAPPIEVRESPLHGLGVFATARIARGERILEYRGERVSHEEADRRYDHKHPGDNHTLLFTVDAHTVIDAGVGGNEARFVNHSCEPNCESVIEA